MPTHDWRRARQEQEHERYQWMRQQIHIGAMPYQPESKLREAARHYANECCREAIARHERDKQ